MSDWQPIDTTPRDEIVTAAHKGSSKSQVLQFFYPLPSKLIDGKWCCEMRPGEWSPYDPQPTHWKPLSAAHRQPLFSSPRRVIDPVT